MKRIGILYDKESKKVFLLPDQVKQLTKNGIAVNVPAGLGNLVGISDNAYSSAGAKIHERWDNVVDASDIILKTNAFNKTELTNMRGKVAITLANYLANVDMLFHMLENGVTGVQWMPIADHSGYAIFPSLEEEKAKFTMNAMKQAFAKGLAKKQKDFVKYPEHPKILILNATFCAVALAKLALKDGYEVTIADRDTKYLLDLKKTLGAMGKFDFIDSSYDTLIANVKDKNAFIATTLNPTDATKLRITKEMAILMPKGSLLIDTSCQAGYAFHFIRKWATKEATWLPVDKSFFMAPADMTDIFAKRASEIISAKSLSYLLKVADQGINIPVTNKLIVCENGKVIDASINSKLRLY